MKPRIRICFVLCTLALGGLVSPAAADTEANKAVARRAIEEIWSQGNLAVADEIIAPDYVYHEPAMGDIAGPEGLKQAVSAYRTAYPDLNFVIDDIIAQNDLVAMRWTASGTQQGELMGIPPTGLHTTSTGINMTRYRDGKAVEDWATWDILGLMQQLGVIPTDHDEYVWGEPSTVTGDPGDALTNTVKVISYTEEVWNRKRVDQVEATHSVDVVVHNPMLPDQPFGLDRYRDATQGFIVEMPDMNVTLHQFVAEGDMVAGRYTVTGTHLPSGKKVTLPGITWYRFADGKVVENWWMYDMYGMMQQIMAGPEWSLAGPWISSIPTPMGNMIIEGVWIAEDTTETSFIGEFEQISVFPVLSDLYPDSEAVKFAGARAVRIASNQYEMTTLEYLTNGPSHQEEIIVGIGILTGTIEIVGPDLLQGQGTGAYYLAAQDADGDGFPDEGQEPAVCFPWQWTGKRLTMMPACVPTPMPE